MCENEHSHIDLLSNEVLQQLVSYLDAKSAVHVCRTCSRLSSLTKFCDTLWKGLIKEDFEVKLHSRAPFMSYYDIYRLLFMSRFILKVYLSERYLKKMCSSLSPTSNYFIYTPKQPMCTRLMNLARSLTANQEQIPGLFEG